MAAGTWQQSAETRVVDKAECAAEEGEATKGNVGGWDGVPGETGITRLAIVGMCTSSEVKRGSLGVRKTRDAGAESLCGQSRLPTGGEKHTVG